MENLHFTHKIKLETENMEIMKKVSEHFKGRYRNLKNGILYFNISDPIYDDIYFFIDIGNLHPIQPITK